jgi:uncharacterized protein (TIGR01244 family)
MARFITVTPRFAVSPQLAAEDVAAARAAGVTLIINNRPDGESPDQPSSAELEDAAKQQGLDYAHIPVVGRPSSDQAVAMSRAVAATSGKALAFCRSGRRSIATWALGELEDGARSRDELLGLAAAAGYDLSDVLSR